MSALPAPVPPPPPAAHGVVNAAAQAANHGKAPINSRHQHGRDTSSRPVRMYRRAPDGIVAPRQTDGHGIVSYSSSPSFHPLAVVPPPNAPPPALLAAETGEQNLCEALVSSVRACISNEVAHFSGDPVPEQAFVNENGKWVGADEAQTPEQVVEAKEEAIKAEAQAKAAKYGVNWIEDAAARQLSSATRPWKHDDNGNPARVVQCSKAVPTRHMIL